MALPPRYRGDELPHFEATVELNGITDDTSSGWSFQVKVYLASLGPETVTFTKTTNIAGSAAGPVTVTWVANEWDVAPGMYRVQLKAQQTVGSAEWTITEDQLVRPRA